MRPCKIPTLVRDPRCCLGPADRASNVKGRLGRLPTSWLVEFETATHDHSGKPKRVPVAIGAFAYLAAAA